MSLLRYFGSKLRHRSVGLLEARRKRVYTLRPLCELCGKYLDAEYMVETWRTGARVLGKHHGQEELVSFELGTETWDETDLASAMRGHRWFLPETKPEATTTPPNNEPALSAETFKVPARRRWR